MGITGLGQLYTPGGLGDNTHGVNVGKRPANFFYTAVVINYISNPVLDLEQVAPNQEPNSETGEFATYRSSLKNGKNRVLNVSRVDKMPRNSIIAQIVTGGEGRYGMAEIFYPFFSPHLSLPLKAGEQVWVFYEEVGRGTRRSDTVGYWISRKSSDIQVDDINYTHQDRVTLGLPNQGASSSARSNQEGESTSGVDAYGFPLGGRRDSGSNTLGGTAPYDSIIDNSYSYVGDFTPEPVPRYSKRSSELAIQGSNNTLISLGEDLGFNEDRLLVGDRLVSQDGAGKLIFSQPVMGRGTIDMVVGRGVTLSDGTTIFDKDPEESKSDALDPSTGSSGDPPGVPIGIAKNTREYIEVDKTPDISEVAQKSNYYEGTPDFINDLSRAYISMKTSGDENFAIDSITNVGSSTENSSVDTDPRSEEPYIILKSTNPRIIARDDGSIKIVHEAGSSIVMDDSGRIQIQGGSICIGSDTADQPYIRYDEWKQVMKNVIEDINELALAVMQINLMLYTCSQVGGANSFSGMAAWKALNGMISALQDTTASDMYIYELFANTIGEQVREYDIKNVQSEIISGE